MAPEEDRETAIKNLMKSGVSRKKAEKLFEAGITNTKDLMGMTMAFKMKKPAGGKPSEEKQEKPMVEDTPKEETQPTESITDDFGLDEIDNLLDSLDAIDGPTIDEMIIENEKSESIVDDQTMSQAEASSSVEVVANPVESTDTAEEEPKDAESTETIEPSAETEEEIKEVKAETSGDVDAVTEEAKEESEDKETTEEEKSDVAPDEGDGGFGLMSECPECGKEIGMEELFCPHCGVVFSDEEESENESEQADDSTTEEDKEPEPKVEDNDLSTEDLLRKADIMTGGTGRPMIKKEEPEAEPETMAGVDTVKDSGETKDVSLLLDDLSSDSKPEDKPEDEKAEEVVEATYDKPEEEKTEAVVEEVEIVQFECPECGSLVNEDANECPNCGVMFASDDDEVEEITSSQEAESSTIEVETSPAGEVETTGESKPEDITAVQTDTTKSVEVESKPVRGKAPKLSRGKRGKAPRGKVSVKAKPEEGPKEKPEAETKTLEEKAASKKEKLIYRKVKGQKPKVTIKSKGKIKPKSKDKTEEKPAPVEEVPKKEKHAIGKGKGKKQDKASSKEKTPREDSGKKSKKKRGKLFGRKK